jgi:hypothetical protein
MTAENHRRANRPPIPFAERIASSQAIMGTSKVSQGALKISSAANNADPESNLQRHAKDFEDSTEF